METHQIDFAEQQEAVQLVLEHVHPSGSALVGTARLRAGERIPAEGESTHPADEYSYVLRGRVQVTAGSETREVTPGTLMVIPAGQGHVTLGLEDAEVLWWWVGQAADFVELKGRYPLPE